MAKTNRFAFQKLVRDKIPEILTSQGITLTLRQLDQSSLLASLKQKLLEEALEVSTADTKKDLLEELADCLEVLLSLAEMQKIPKETLEKRRLSKKNENGGFEQAVFIESIEMSPDSPAVSYYKKRPAAYPELL